MEFIRLKTRIFEPNFNLFEGIIEAILRNKQVLENKDILIVNSKIVAVSQGRIVYLESINKETKANTASERQTKSFAAGLKPTRKDYSKISHYGKGVEDPRFVALVQKEADFVVPGHMLLTIKNGIFTPAAGIDRSNAPRGSVILWLEKPWDNAVKLQQSLKKYYKLRNLGLVIADSTCYPLRAGTSGVALAWAGFEGIEDVRGKKDIFGKPLTVTRKAVADNLACSAQLLMGEANEKVPMVIARNVPVIFTSVRQNPKKSTIRMKDCLYSGLYKNLE